MKKSRLFSFTRAFLSLFAILVLLSACADTGIEVDPTYKNKERDEMYKNGSLASDGGGLTLLGMDDTNKAKDGGALGVNAYLWRASLDTISFMPIMSADPFGGVITTDWYSAPEAQGERMKLNVLIIDRDLRADGVRVSVFRQIRTEKGDWQDVSMAPSTAIQLEDTILTRARQLRLAQKEQF